MPSRKQRRRREKLQRHEWEYVVETEEGEVPLASPREVEAETAAKRDGRKAADDVRDRRGRPIPKPSLERVLKRSAIFGPLLLAVVFLTAPASTTTAQKVFQAAVLLAFFMPFSYLVDVLVYRALMRRQERG